jgi:hypothetical protein
MVFRRQWNQAKRTINAPLRPSFVVPPFIQPSGSPYACFTSTGNGSRKTFRLHFDYLDATHLTITVNSVAQSYPSDWAANGRVITFTTAPGNGLAVSVCRTTPHSSTWIEFSDLAPITPRNISDSIKQAMYYAEEIRDATL